MLSDTTVLHRASLRAGRCEPGRLRWPNHRFWYDPNLPESREANGIIANFLDTHLGTK
jgi:epsilon-lactone hydrolase